LTNIYLFGRGKEYKNDKGDICAVSLLCVRYGAFGLQGFLFLIFYSARAIKGEPLYHYYSCCPWLIAVIHYKIQFVEELCSINLPIE
jgi:hypothetical protein